MATSIIEKSLASDVASLNDALANMTAGIDTTGHGTVAAQSSETINGFRNGLLFTYRNNTNNGIFAIYGGSSVFTFVQSSSPTMSVTASNNNVTLTNSSGAQAWYIFFRWTS